MNHSSSNSIQVQSSNTVIEPPSYDIELEKEREKTKQMELQIQILNLQIQLKSTPEPVYIQTVPENEPENEPENVPENEPENYVSNIVNNWCEKHIIRDDNNVLQDKDMYQLFRIDNKSFKLIVFRNQVKTFFEKKYNTTKKNYTEDNTRKKGYKGFNIRE